MKTIKYNNDILKPSKVICIGRNYVEHIHELNNEIPENMVLFNKPNSAISDELYFIEDDCRFEAEICFLIQNNTIKGIGFGLDLTKANIQNYLKSKSLPWERAKGFNNSAVFSNFVPFKGDIQTLEMKLYINDVLTQYATYELMIYKPKAIIEEILSFMEIEDYDILMSGTPKGVSTYKIGDIFRGEIYVENQQIISHMFIAK